MADFNNITRGNFRNELMGTLRSFAPYSNKGLVELITQDNPKYKDFYAQGTRRDELLTKHSITQGNPYDVHPMGDITMNGDYHSFMYANVEPDKIKRLKEYRLMAEYDFVSTALNEICDEFIVIDDKDKIFNFSVRDGIDKSTRETLDKEFYKFIQYFDLENRGWEYCRNILIDGELYFEHIIHEEHRDKGILGVLSIPTESIDPIFNNVQNLLVRGFLLRKEIYDEKTKQVKEIIPIILDKNQITYFHSNEWNSTKTFRLPVLEHARRPYKQLNMIEDSIVIYRMVNAPEKLVFNVDFGNMPNPDIERKLAQISQKFWTKKTYDSKQGGVSMFNPQSMIDAFWFPKRQGSDGTSVEKLQGNSNLGDLPDLDFFTKKLFQSLNVPVSRLSPDTTYSDGMDMVREELKFAKFIIRLQRQFAETIKQSFITHLKLRGWWDEYGLVENDIKLKMNEPTHFHVLREQQIFEIKSNNYSAMAQSELVSETYAQKKYLGWDDKTVLANREHLRKEMEFKFELAQIQTYGPDWRNVAAEEAGGAADSFEGSAGGGGMPDIGGGSDDMGGDDVIDIEPEGGDKDFGTTPQPPDDED